MTHLEKITLSNIRRFGDNVEIELAKGATIFLAPNGTGKTAIFEAIELAVTGKVKRLLYPPEPLIRDHQSQASIKLSFAGDKFCEAIFTKGLDPVLLGDHAEIFGKVEVDDLPFLLQLTHFLNQQGNNWFVTAHGPEAGSQLDHLAIGKEATEVNQLIPSAKRAAHVELQDAQRSYDEINNLLQTWLTLLDKKTNVGASVKDDLVSTPDLLARLTVIAGHIPDFQVKPSDKLLNVRLTHGELNTANAQNLLRSRERRTSLSGLEETVKSGGRIAEQLDSERAELRKQQALLSEKLAEKNILEVQLSAETNQHLTKQKTLIRHQEAIGILKQYQLLIGQIEGLNERKILLEKLVAEGTIEKEKLEATVNQIEIINANYQVLIKRQQKLDQDYNQIEALKQALVDLNLINAEYTVLTKEKIPNLLSQKNQLTARIATERVDEKNKREILIGYQTQLAVINDTNGLIKNAVSTIMTNFPKDRGDCPVCGEEYAPAELSRRMALSAQKIDPAIKTLTNNIAKSQLDVDQAVRIIASTNVELTELNTMIDDIGSLAKEKKSEKTYILLSNFPSCQSIEDAASYISHENTKWNEDRAALSADLGKAQQAEPNRLLTLSQELLTLNEQLIKQTDDLRRLTVELANASASLLPVSDNLQNETNIETLVAKASESEAEVKSSSQKIFDLRQNIDRTNQVIDDIRSLVLNIDLNIAKLSTSLGELTAQWTNARLTGELDLDVLNLAILAEDRRYNILESDQVKLEQIDRELSKWQIIEDNSKIDEEIKITRAERTEIEYTDYLNKELSAKRIRLASMTLKTKILEEFSRSLSQELDVVQDRIKSINPLWTKLLKRVIIEPRFSATKLESFSYYKKQHASVNVKVHGQDVLVSQVASEAQITDLQLTFLMAMAQKYQWTPWKTLLLDDPTQHHDLVHASAVFDLLRDYIADFDFQVLLATHDPVQAKFFMRKLENDGIPAKLVTLYASDAGVTAKAVN